MIRVKNVDEYIITLNVPGTLTAAANKAVARVPFTGFLRNIYAKLGTAGTGATGTTLDINKNGVSVFSSGNITLAATTGALSVGVFTTDPPQVSAGDILTLDADGVSTSPANLAVDVLVSKTPPAACGHVANLDAA